MVNVSQSKFSLLLCRKTMIKTQGSKIFTISLIGSDVESEPMMQMVLKASQSDHSPATELMRKLKFDNY